MGIDFLSHYNFSVIPFNIQAGRQKYVIAPENDQRK